jgi:hypothetical protein
MTTDDEVLRITPRITALPVIHGSGDCAVEVRRRMLAQRFDCLAVPLPPSFQSPVEQAITLLPYPTLVVQQPAENYAAPWQPEEELDEDQDDEELPDCSYVPVDPCQPVIAALRVAMGEHIPRAFLDLETAHFQTYSQVLPDPYALKRVSLPRFAAAVLPSIAALPEGQPPQRIARMACRLRALEKQYRSILLVCSILDWPWLRDACREGREDVDDETIGDTRLYRPEPEKLLFMLGELPFITGLYEQARSQLDDDENLSIDGVKELLIAARQKYRVDLKSRARKITPHLLSLMLKYIRNLSLIERRFTPDLYTLVIAAKQVAGDQFALHVAETARDYPFPAPSGLDAISLGIERGRLPDGEVVDLTSRLPGPPIAWRSCQLRPRPERQQQQRWEMQWNPYSQCSYPPEDERIENFRAHLFDRARTVMGADLARTEKFTTSIQDGIDIRDTLRHWYEGDIYVKVLPPSQGGMDCAVMLFDSPADPRDYPWRSTWYAEHAEESTLAFFASDYRQEMLGPGIAVATYGGALFLFPPLVIPDIWRDQRLDFAETLEERLLAAACLHSRHRQIVLLSSLPPGAGWRRMARRFGKHFVHLPLSHFSDSTVQQLRIVHVLNGKQVRSYADKFIRRP